MPDEPEPLLEPDPEPDADAEMPLPEPEKAGSRPAGGRSRGSGGPLAGRSSRPSPNSLLPVKLLARG